MKGDVDSRLVQILDDLLCKRWTLLLLMSLARTGRKRYTELLRELEGISPKTLSERLKALENAGIIEKTYYKEIPPRVEYSLTKKGEELIKSMTPMIDWAKKWMRPLRIQQ